MQLYTSASALDADTKLTPTAAEKRQLFAIAAVQLACSSYSESLCELLEIRMDGAFPAESQGGEGEYAGDDKRGFRGTSENAKTKMCMR